MTYARSLALSLLAAASACGSNHSSATDAPISGGDGGSGAGSAAVPDARFKWVGAFPSYTVVNSLAGATGTLTAATNGLWMPAHADGLEVEAYLVAPDTEVQTFSTALDSARGSGSGFEADETLQYVITSLGFNGAGAVVTYQGVDETNQGLEAANGSGDGSGSELPDFVAAAIGQGYVTTAFGFDGSAAHYVAYANTASTTTYDAQALTGSAADIATMATTLAQGGYIITAFGSLDAATFGMVGTRVSGTTTAREAMVIQNEGSGGGQLVPPTYLANGWAIVGGYATADPSFALSWIIER